MQALRGDPMHKVFVVDVGYRSTLRIRCAPGALKWYRRACRSGSKQAARWLASLFLAGRHVERDVATAYDYLMYARELGDDSEASKKLVSALVAEYPGVADTFSSRQGSLQNPFVATGVTPDVFGRRAPSCRSGALSGVQGPLRHWHNASKRERTAGRHLRPVNREEEEEPPIVDPAATVYSRQAC